MKDYPVLASKSLCTGCGSCYNACTTSAINLKADIEGFYYPVIQNDKCIKCGLCMKSCPVMHPIYKNSDSPQCYAMMATDEERKKSSSGAFIPSIAQWVVKQHGVVFGASWNEDWSVSIKCVHTKDELETIRGSKYLQASTELTYREALKNLQDNKWVLYTGTPCEISGLYGFIGNHKFNNLITVEVICHGAPSYKVFKKYLDENFNTNKITNISFREKSSFGWGGGFHIYYADGQEFHEHADNNIYCKAFNHILIQRPACAACLFSRLPRQADFSAGDFWGVSKFDPKLTDKLGTSFVLVNNDHHQDVLNNISKDFKLWKDIPINAVTKINKTVLQPFKSHPGRKHFFSTIERKPFSILVKNSFVHHYDIGIVGLWYGINYGSILTYYALYNLIKDIGLDPVMLPKPNCLWNEEFNSQDSIAQKFIWKHCNVFLPFGSQSSYEAVNNLCNDFVVGSDVVWNYEICGNQSGHFFFLDFVTSGHKKISFASSFGNKLTGPEKHQKLAKFYLNDFDAISCRESCSVSALQNIVSNKKITHVLDPVFVCDKKYFDIPNPNLEARIKNKFCFSYLLNRDLFREKQLIIGLVCKIHQLSNIICGNPHALDRIRNTYGPDVSNIISVEDWLTYMKNTSFYVGDSYHGLCFALIFHKPFIIIYNKSYDAKRSSIQRFLSLLSIVGLEERLVSQYDDLNTYIKLIQKNIDWKIVDNKILQVKKQSLEWLIKALKN